jgi:hypothetical protein
VLIIDGLRTTLAFVGGRGRRELIEGVVDIGKGAIDGSGRHGGLTGGLGADEVGRL